MWVSFSSIFLAEIVFFYFWMGNIRISISRLWIILFIEYSFKFYIIRWYRKYTMSVLILSRNKINDTSWVTASYLHLMSIFFTIDLNVFNIDMKNCITIQFIWVSIIDNAYVFHCFKLSMLKMCRLFRKLFKIFATWTIRALSLQIEQADLRQL